MLRPISFNAASLSQYGAAGLSYPSTLQQSSRTHAVSSTSVFQSDAHRSLAALEPQGSPRVNHLRTAAPFSNRARQFALCVGMALFGLSACKSEPDRSTSQPATVRSAQIKEHGIFPGNLSQSEQTLLTKIQNYCETHGFKLMDSWTLAQHMNPRTNGERLNTLVVTSVLLSLQKGKTDGFYHAKNKQGETENKQFIDTVVERIHQGKLRIKDGRKKQKQKGLELAGLYRYEDNTVSFYQSLDITSLNVRSTIVHEIFHFYQDLQKLRIQRLEVERTAHIKAGEYMLYDQGILGPSEWPSVESLITRHFRTFWKEHPKQLGIKAAYAQRVQDVSAFNEWNARLVESIERYIMTDLFAQVLTPVANKAAKIVQQKSPAYIRERQIPAAKQAAESAYQQIEALINQSDPTQIDPHLLQKKLGEFVNYQTYAICFEEMLRMIESGSLNFQFSLSDAHPAVQQMLSRLVRLRLDRYLYRDYDG